MSGDQPAVNSTAALPQPKIKHDWYQTETHVVITILLKNAPKDKVKIEYGEQSLSVSSPIANSQSEYSLEVELANRIVCQECSYTVSPSKIEVKLKKRDGIRWINLEGQTKSMADSVKPIPQAIIDASGPQTSASVKNPSSCPFRKDWNKIEKELKKQEEEEQPQGEAALNALFQKIYGEGSDEVRKAMNKSFMESGGTVLSTNWTEVEKDKVNIQPPDGMEWKKWE